VLCSVRTVPLHSDTCGDTLVRSDPDQGPRVVTLPSQDLKCGDSGYMVLFDKVPGFYGRFTMRISRLLEDGYVEPGNLWFNLRGKC